MEIFDSLAIDNNKLETLKKTLKFRGLKTIHINEDSFQKEDSDSCGLFVIYYIWQRMHNLDLTFDEVLEQSFTTDKTINEEKVKQFCSWLEEQTD